MGYIIPLSEARYSDRAQIGLKSARLGELISAGFRVPNGFCLTMSAYKTHLSGAHAEQVQVLVEQRAFARLRRQILESDVPEDLVRDILNRFERMPASEAASLAVRSSSSAEDLDGHSFAGLYETRLGVSGPEELLVAVRQCWASYWSNESVAYRELAGVEHGQHGMSVLVQTMVEPTVSGVLFTENPLDQESETAVIELVDGIGESLVGGDRRARRVTLRRDDGTVVDDSEGDRGQTPTFLDRLWSSGRSVEEHFGEPQDIEWAEDCHGSIWLLQTRPVTKEAGLTLNPERGWKRAYDEPFSTLGCDLARRRHGRWIGAINDLYGTRFQPEFRATAGWLYFRAPWRSPSRLSFCRMKAIQLYCWLRGARIAERYETRRARHLRDLDEIANADLSALTPAQLSSRISEAVDHYLNLQSWSYPAVELAKTAAALLERSCSLLFAPKDGIQYSDLLSGLDNPTVRRDLALHRLGKQLAELLKETEVESFEEASLEAVRQQGSKGEQFWLSLQGFLAEYGYVWADRYPRDPAWELNQGAMAATLSHLIEKSGDLEATVARRRQRRQERVEQASALLTGRPLGSLCRPLFQKVLGMAERHFPRKEERNHDVYRSVMVIRTLAGEVGRRLESTGVIQAETDVTMMTTAEITEALDDGYARDWRAVIDERRLPQPMVLRQTRAMRESSSANRSAGLRTLAGEPCSPGLGRGPACVVRRFDELRKVLPGDIVVCRNFRPAWSTVFIRASGIVVETGSLLSHGATLAREYGVAAVMNVADATSQVVDGDSITVDGNIGLVTVEPRAAVAEVQVASA